MNDEQFAQMLEELMGKIDDGPGSHTEAFAKLAKKYAAAKELEGVIVGLNESLGAIRLVIKYLVFDLEATRRERDQLRMLLEDQD